MRCSSDTVEAQLDPGYSVATERAVRDPAVERHAVDGPRPRLPSERTRSPQRLRARAGVFRYVETADGTVIVNAAHIVELRETTRSMSARRSTACSG